MSDDWYLKSAGRVQGPFSFTAFQQLAQDGTLKPEDKVRSGLDGPWRFANSVPRLFAPRRIGLGAARIVDSTADAAPESSDSSQSSRWYCRTLGMELGPLSCSELRRMMDRGEISVDDEIRESGQAEWRLVGQVLDTALRTDVDDTTSHRSAAADPLAQLDDDDWYYCVGGREHGPTSLKELKALVAVSGEIAAEILVRLGQSGEWIPFTACIDTRDPVVTTVEAASPPAPIAQAGVRFRDEFPRPSDLQHSSARKASSGSRRGMPTALGKLNLAEYLRANFDLIVAIVVLVVLNTVVFAVMQPKYSTEARYYETFGSLSAELQSMADRKASEEEWKKFRARAEKTLEPILADLKKTANVSEPIRQHLYWAGHDHLREMLSSEPHRPANNGTPSEDEIRFNEQMRWVEQALSSHE